MFTPEAFEQMATETMEKVKRGEMSRDELRALAANTFEVAVDAQGRVSIDATLREFAGLELSTRVVVAGLVRPGRDLERRAVRGRGGPRRGRPQGRMSA